MRFNIWSVLSVIIIIFLLFSLYGLFGIIKTANDNYALATQQKKTLESELEKAYSQKKSLETELFGIKDERDSLTSRISELENRTQKDAEDNYRKISKMSAEIDNLKAELAAKESALSKKDGEIQSLQAKIKKAVKKIVGMADHMAEKGSGPSGVSLQPITVTSEAKKIDAKVLDVNKQYNFAVIGAGLADGIKPDDTLFVFRKGELLGKVIVEKSDAGVCVAKILYKSLADNIRKGDSVTN